LIRLKESGCGLMRWGEGSKPSDKFLRYLDFPEAFYLFEQLGFPSNKLCLLGIARAKTDTDEFSSFVRIGGKPIGSAIRSFIDRCHEYDVLFTWHKIRKPRISSRTSGQTGPPQR
jgi:hypothetical protein